jgi:transcriptional regulator with XRE-family HTH domain
MIMVMKHPLRAWLDSKPETQEAFAARVGISRMHLWRILNGETPSRDLAVKMQDATDGDIRAAFLLKLEDAA